jgi:hypothetical protein
VERPDPPGTDQPDPHPRHPPETGPTIPRNVRTSLAAPGGLCQDFVNTF